MTDTFGRALQAITEDGDSAFLFAQRDFSSLGEHDLTEREQDLLQAAAAEAGEDDVSGFQFSPDRGPAGFMKLGDIEGMVHSRRFREALDYYQYKLEN